MRRPRPAQDDVVFIVEKVGWNEISTVVSQ
jgi:hypothetical protein